MAVIYAEEMVPASQIDAILDEYGYEAKNGRKPVNYKYSQGTLKIPFQLEIKRHTYKAVHNTPSVPQIEVVQASTLETAQRGVGEALKYATGAWKLAEDPNSGRMPRMGFPGDTEGIEIELVRYNKETNQEHPVCKRVRWVQTVERIEWNVPGATLRDHYVDNRAPHPFFGTGNSNPHGKTRFWDWPCASPNHKTTWEAVLSLVTWEGEKALRIHAAMSYGFEVLPDSKRLVHLKPLQDASQPKLGKHKSVVSRESGFNFL